MARRGLPGVAEDWASRLRRVLAAIDHLQEGRGWLAVPWAVFKKFQEDSASNLAGLIAYHGLLSLFPLLLLLAAVLNLVLHGNPQLQSQVLAAAARDFPALSQYVKSASAGASGTAVGIGLVGALWAGLGVTRACERAFNNVWDVPMADRPNFLAARIRGLGLLGLLGTTTLLSTAVAALGSVGGPLGIPLAVVGALGPLAINFGLYLLAFQLLTNIHVAWRQLVPGAVLGAVGWTLLQNLGTFFIQHEVSHASAVYGSFAVVIAILAWIYLGGQLTLYAAEVNVVWGYHLWPRSLSGPPRTEADVRALQRMVAEARRPGSGPAVEVGRPPGAGGSAT